MTDELRYELDARNTLDGVNVFLAFDRQVDAMRSAESLVEQGFAWVRVQRTSVWTDVLQSLTVFEHGEAKS